LKAGFAGAFLSESVDSTRRQVVACNSTSSISPGHGRGLDQHLKIVTHHAPTNPAFHAFHPTIAATRQTIAALEYIVLSAFPPPFTQIPGHIDNHDSACSLRHQTNRENPSALVMKKILVPLPFD
jgi:hypothetical protein